MRLLEHTENTRETKIVYKILVGIPEWKKSLEIRMCSFEYNIKMDLKGGKQ